MSGFFSFIKHPMAHMLQMSGKLVPGIEKAVALYYYPQTQELRADICNYPSQNNDIEPLYLSDNNTIDSLRTQNRNFSWHTASNLPFETIDNSKTQLNIFDEHENVVLCLSFKNSDDNKSDLLFLFLNHNKGNFGLANSEIPLTTDEKTIIGKLTYNSLFAIYQQQILDSEVLKKTNIRLKSIEGENEQLKQEIDRLKAEYNSSKIIECNSILNKIAKAYNVNMEFSKGAIDKITKYKGNFNKLKEQINESAINAINSNFGINTPVIVLNGWDINFNTAIDIPEIQNEEVAERYHKTLQLLDKLEHAAKVVLNNNRKLTSENVGGACPIPISAPAISDALKNHHKKVMNLMSDYPDRWPIIKNEFRPIKNILWGNTG